MVDRSNGMKGVLRVFGYDPEGPAAPPPKAPTVQPVWSQQDIEDWIKNMGGPWFIPPCLTFNWNGYDKAMEPEPFENADFRRMVEATLEVSRREAEARLRAAEFRRLMREADDGRTMQTVNAAYAHLNGASK